MQRLCVQEREGGRRHSMGGTVCLLLDRMDSMRRRCCMKLTARAKLGPLRRGRGRMAT